MRKSKFLIIINVMRQTFFAVHKNHMKNVYPKLKKKIGELQKGNSTIELGEFETCVLNISR